MKSTYINWLKPATEQSDASVFTSIRSFGGRENR